jgi:hypothetical protein
MLWLLFLGLAALVQAHAPGSTVIDVSALAVGAPTTVTELDLGKLKGDLRQLAWSADGTQFYVQTVERRGKEEVPHHYMVAGAGGTVTPADAEPAWATEYWKFKSDRYAPGLPEVVIDVKTGIENVKYGTGSAGAADRSNGTGGDNDKSSGLDNVGKAAMSQQQATISLVLFDETIGQWMNARPTPGTTFSWGPTGSGALAFVDGEGRIVFLDQQKHKQRITGTKEACLPAWSTDGSRLAYLYKAGRNKYALAWSTVSRR